MPARHVWVLTFVDVFGKREPVIDNFGMRAFFTRRMAEKHAFALREEDKREGIDTQISVTKYVPSPVRGDERARKD